jgi:Na+/H+ antiporter NhaD/arsenite permease-like protein
VTVAGALDWIGDNGTLLGVLGLVSILSLIATLALLPFLVVRIPEDYFRHRHRRHDDPRERHPLAHHAIVVAKNTLGVALILAGLAMLVLPGQGLLTLLIGLMLTDFPGKYTLEKRIVGQPGVLRAVNWLRQRAGHPPVLAPVDGD